MDNQFTHLHVHSDYSLLDGAITIEKLITSAKKYDFKSIAITDHGNIFGAVKFFQQAKKASIKPILGMEAYLTEDAAIKSADNKYYHLIVLVQNSIGYKNLCKLISFSYQDGFYFKPRIDYRMLEKHNEGLIVTTACLGGHIPSLLMQEQYEEVDRRVDFFLSTFGKERFYLEVQPEDQKEQRVLNNKLFELSSKHNINTIAAGDCHYPYADDREAHEVMLAIQTHNKITDPDRFTFGDCRPFIRSTQEMLEQFPGREEAIWNTGKVAALCDFSFETGKLFFPQFKIPETFTEDSYFDKLCHDGLDKLIAAQRIDADNTEIYWSRLKEEVSLIIKMGYVGYFLVVSDFIGWAREHGIPVGPGRGSAAGSLVAWALQITDIDPIKYNLLFERFLNPERVSMPDIDIDFCIEGRDAVINYVKDAYGHDKVCQIITFGTMLAKGVIKDVARALGFPFEDSNALTDLIPEQLKITLTEALEQEPKLKELIAQNPKIAHLFEIALKLEGITRHASKHAAGIVISPEPIDTVLPVYIPPKTTDLVTQYGMTELESLGFLKMDFLGLKNLTLIDRAVRLIEKNHGIRLDITKLDLTDLKTFALLCRGDTSGVFQLESDGLRDVLRRLQPATFEDIIAVNALYRPGPLGSGMVDDFIARKHGTQKITYIFPELEPILQETYGVIVYQEQVMKIASTIAGYSLGESDILRRAMGKKKAEVMAEQKTIFSQKAVERNFDKKKADDLFELMAYFAGYGFNKSHSAAYALIAYQTAYLKANFAPEFMACLISLEAGDAEKMAFYLGDAKDMGLVLLPPDINQSEIEFSVDAQKRIRFGLRGIKNVGLAALENILLQRAEESFSDMLDFCSRVELRTCNKRVIESLICAGAFDSLPGNRAQKSDEIGKIIDIALEKKKAELTGQLGLFGMVADPTSPQKSEGYVFTFKEDWPTAQKLEKEKEMVGLYLSAQPLDAFAHELKWLQANPFKSVPQKKANEIIICCGTLQSMKEVTTKKGDKMAFLQLEDYSSKAEIVLFPKTYAQVQPWLSEYHVFLVRGVPDETATAPKIKANMCIPLELLFEQWVCERVTLTLPAQLSEDILLTLKNKIVPGSTVLEFELQEGAKTYKILSKQKVRLDSALLKSFHEDSLQIKVHI